MTKDIKIQLYTENNKGVDGYLSLTEASDFPFTISLADIKDPSKRSATFSKSINLGGTKNNNNILGHYYDVNIQSLQFDINKIQKCRVLINGEVIYDNCVMQLLEINKTQPNSSYEFNIEYVVQIKSETGNLFDIIKNKELSDITFTTLDIPNNADPSQMIYDPYWVINSFNNNYSDGYKMIIQQTTPSSIQSEPSSIIITSFKPSIYLWQYFNRIISDAGYRYTFNEIGVINSTLVNPTVDELHFRKLLVPYTDKLDADVFSNVVYYRVKGNMSGTHSPYLLEGNDTQPNGVLKDSPDYIIPTDDNIIDYSSSFDTITNTYKSSFTGVLDIKITNDYEAYFKNGTGSSIKATPATPYAQLRVIVQNFIIKNGVVIYAVNQNVGGVDIAPNTVFSGTSTYIGNSQGTNNISIQVIPLDEVQVGTRILAYNFGFSYPHLMEFRDLITGNIVTDFSVDMELKSQSVIFESRVGNGGLNYGSIIDFNNYIPKKVKQSDFLKSVLNAFNVFVEVDSSDPNLLIFTTRDQYYSNGNTHNLTHKLCKDKQQNIEFLSEITNKEKYLTYKQDKFSLNEDYVSEYVDTYGSARFRFDNEYVTGEDKIELIFSPSPIYMDDDKYITDLSTTESLRLLYDGGEQSCNTYSIRGWVDSGVVNTSVYPLTTHQNNPLNPTYDLNFGVCFTYYHEYNSITESNLLNNYWRRTLHQINTSRILTAYFNLDEQDIKNIKLNDLIYIDNSYWYINKIIDFNPVKTNITKVELISIDDLQTTSSGVIIDVDETKPTRPRKPGGLIDNFVFGNVVFDGSPATTGKGILNGFGNITAEETFTFGNDNINTGVGGTVIGNTNTNTGIGSSIIGDNNNINGNGSTAIGQNNNIDATGSMVVGFDNDVNSTGIVMGDNNTVPPFIAPSVVIGNNINPTTPGLWVDEINGVGIEDILSGGDLTIGTPITAPNNLITNLGEDFIDDLDNDLIWEDEVVVPDGVLVNNNGELDVMSYDDFASTLPLFNVTDVTRSELLDMITNSELIPGQHYMLTDVYNVIMIALENNVAKSVYIKRRLVKNDYYNDNGAGSINCGVLRTGTTFGIGGAPEKQNCVWGGRAWLISSLSSGTLTGLPTQWDDATTGTGYTDFVMVDESDDDYYFTAYLDCNYGIEEDVVYSVSDWKGNTIIDPLPKFGFPINGIYSDFGNIYVVYNKVENSIMNNSSYYIVNNSSIYGNIVNNSGAYVSVNVMKASISNNTGDISSNYCYSISNNTGDIFENVIPGAINNNTISGIIIDNYNKGSISNNTSSGSTSNSISNNTNNGSISGNTFDTDNVSIRYNTNNGDISSATRSVTVEDTRVHK